MEAFVRYGRRCERDRQRAVLTLHDLASTVEQLAEDLAAVSVDGVCDLAVPGDAVIVVGHEHVVGVLGALVNARDLQHDESGTAGRASLVVGDQTVGDLPFSAITVSWPEDRMRFFKRDRADLQRAEQVGEHLAVHWLYIITIM